MHLHAFAKRFPDKHGVTIDPVRRGPFAPALHQLTLRPASISGSASRKCAIAAKARALRCTTVFRPATSLNGNYAELPNLYTEAPDRDSSIRSNIRN